jgi:hypothetical protein
MVVTRRIHLTGVASKTFSLLISGNSKIPKLAFSCVLFRKILACHCVLCFLPSLRTCEQNLRVTTTVSFPSSTPPPPSLLVSVAKHPRCPCRAQPCPALRRQHAWFSTYTHAFHSRARQFIRLPCFRPCEPRTLLFASPRRTRQRPPD